VTIAMFVYFNVDVDLAMQVTGGETPTIYLDGINSLMTALSGSNVEVKI
jgi:hypothetical protein